MGKVEKLIYFVLLLFFVVIVNIIFMIPPVDAGQQAIANAEMAKVSEEPVVDTEKEDAEDVEYYSDEEIVDYLNGFANGTGMWQKADDAYFVFYPDEEFGSALSLLYEYPHDDRLLPYYHDILETMKGYTDGVDNAYGKTCRLAIMNPLDHSQTMAEFKNGKIVYDAISEL